MSIIDKPSDYFNTVLYTGTENSNTISVGFEPNFTWIKRRNSARDHQLFNSITGANTVLSSNLTSAEEGTGAGGWTPNSDGFVVHQYVKTNSNGDTYVGWNWKAGTSFTNDASATGIGSIDSTGSVNQEAGFSIISYTGIGGTNQSVAHGLGATPKFIIIKARSASGYWPVTNPRFVSVSDPNILYLQITGAEADDTNINGTTAPSSTVFGVDDYNAVNVNGQTQIAYCFTPIKNYSSMSTYVGNGNADGPFVYTGFKPAFVMIRRADSASNWTMIDNKRDVDNVVNTQLVANGDGAEFTETVCDFLSNGFKIRAVHGGYLNASGGSYTYMAFAENPFVTSTDNGSIPTTAR